MKDEEAAAHLGVDGVEPEQPKEPRNRAERRKAFFKGGQFDRKARKQWQNRKKQT